MGRARRIGTQMSWTDDRVEMLRKLFADGLSYGQIAIVLGGVSRNRCISKGARIGLPTRITKGGARKAPPIKRAGEPRIATAPLPIAPIAEPSPVGPVRDFPLAGCCKFIRSEIVGDWRCCGAETARYDLPFCDYHLRLCYQPAIKRRAA